MTTLAWIGLASPSGGTMLAFVAYTHDIQGIMAPAVCVQAAMRGKS